MHRLTKQAAAASRLHKLASVAKLVKYSRAMEKMAGSNSGRVVGVLHETPGSQMRRMMGETNAPRMHGSSADDLINAMNSVMVRQGNQPSGGVPKAPTPVKPKGRNLLKKKSGGYKRANQTAATMSPGKALMMGGALGYVPGKILQKRLKPQAKPIAPQPAQSPGAMNNKAGGYKRAWDWKSLNLQNMVGMPQTPQENPMKAQPTGPAPVVQTPTKNLRVGSSPRAIPPRPMTQAPVPPAQPKRNPRYPSPAQAQITAR